MTRLLRHWFASRALTMVDGRARRGSLAQKQRGTPAYERLADDVKRLWDEGLADVQIAERLACSPPTVVAAFAHWHTSRGLVAPTHAERRTALVDRMLELYDRGRKMKEIASEVGMCSRTVTLLLRERFTSLGRPMPDGRTRRAARVRGQQATNNHRVDRGEPPPSQ